MRLQELTIMTWNVNGLDNSIKCGLVTKALTPHKPDIVLLQETHLMDAQHNCMGRGRYKIGSYAQYSSGSRGVLILPKKSLPFQIKKAWVDSQGCYVALHIEWEGAGIILLNVYAPSGMQMG